MNTQETRHNMKWAVYSGSLALMLASIIALAMFAFPTVAWSQVDEWTVYNTANSGLPYNGVTALAIDAQGTIWVGTGRWYAFAGGGLAKFDGQNWTVYNTANSPLPGNDHISLSIDAKGNVWSGTETGLSKFDGQNWTVYLTSNSGLPHNQAGAPVFDAEGNAWIGTGAGLAKFDGQHWTVYNQTNSGMPAGLVTGLAIDAQGVLWIGTFGSGLVKFDGQKWTVYNTGNSGLTYNSISFMSVARDGSLWTGTYGGGLIHFANGQWTTFTSSNSPLPHNMVWNVMVDPHGNVWAATQAGLAVFHGIVWTIYDKTNSGLPDNNVYSLAIDAKGNIWVGTESGGLAVYWALPAVDFNGDGTLDFKDFSILAQSWGLEESSVDIGPSRFGDGTVDIQDVATLAEYWLTYPGAMAHWKLDETEGGVAHDSIKSKDGFGPPGLLWRPKDGKVGGALELDGVDDLLFTTFSLDPAAGAFSVFAWIKGGAPGQVIISQIGSVNWLSADSSEGKLMTNLAIPPGGRFVPQPLVSEFVITDGDWHRVGFTWDGKNRILYVDDVEVAKDTQASLAGSQGGLYIGAGKNREAGSFWSGLIDDVRIYNRAIKP